MPDVPSAIDLVHGNVAATLKRMRLDGGVTQEALAERLGKSQSYVTRMERGASGADLSEIQLWAVACGYEVTFGVQKVGSGAEAEDTEHYARREALAGVAARGSNGQLALLSDLTSVVLDLDPADAAHVLDEAGYLQGRGGARRRSPESD